MKTVTKLCLLALFALFFVDNNIVWADNKPPVNPTRAVHRTRGPKVPARNSEGADLKALEKPPDMPGISFPNAKFLYGFNTETKTGRNLGARFEVPDSPSSVLNYYRETLKQNGWKVNEEGKIKANQVVASHKQYKSAVTITTLQSPKAGCQVYFSYGMRNN